MHLILMWMMRMLSIFWRSFHIFIILLNKCNLCVEMMWTSAMHFLYFFHHYFHWFLWYCAIAMLSLVKIIAARANYLHLDYIFASSWIKLFRSITFLMMKKREMMWLTFIRWTCISLHAYLIFCIQLLTQLRNVILSCSMFKWTCSELVYISAFRVSMLTAMYIEWTKFFKIENHSLFIWLLHAVEMIKLKLCIKFVHNDCMLKNEYSCHFKLLQQLRFHHHFHCCLETLHDWNDDSIVHEVNVL